MKEEGLPSFFISPGEFIAAQAINMENVLRPYR